MKSWKETYINIVLKEDGHVPGASIKNQLTSLVRNSQKLLDSLDESKEYPQWWVNKLVKAADYVDTAADFSQNKIDQNENVNEKVDGYRSSYKDVSKYNGKKFDRKLEFKTLDKIQKALEVADKHHSNLQYPYVVDTVTRLWDHLAKASVGIIEYKRNIEAGKYDGVIDKDD